MHARSQIGRYLAVGLPPRAEARLRSHLRECSSCRSHYDEQVALYRILAGDPQAPTLQEEERMVRLALQAAGLARAPDGEKRQPSLLDRILWAPAPTLAAAGVLVFLIVAGSIWLLQPPVIAARLVKGWNLTLDEIPVDLKATPRAVVRAGSKLEVKKDGIAKLSLERGGTVRVFPGSIISLDGPGERLDLDRGKVWCLVEHTGAPFVVRTDVAEVRVVGTSFVVERRRSGETEVRVMKGEVEVRDKKRRGTVRVKSGRRTRVDPGNPPSQPRRYDPSQDRSLWERFLDELIRCIERVIKEVEDFFEGK